MTVEQLISFTPSDLMNMESGIGAVSIQQTQEALSKYGLSLKTDQDVRKEYVQHLLDLPREELLDLPIRDLGIPIRLCNVIEAIEPEAVVRGFTEMTEDDLLKLDKVGVDSVNEAKVILHSYGIYLAEELPMVEKWYSVQHTGTVKYNVMFGDKKVLDCYSEQCANSIVELLNEDLKSIQ